MLFKIYWREKYDKESFRFSNPAAHFESLPRICSELTENLSYICSYLFKQQKMLVTKSVIFKNMANELLLRKCAFLCSNFLWLEKDSRFVPLRSVHEFCVCLCVFVCSLNYVTFHRHYQNRFHSSKKMINYWRLHLSIWDKNKCLSFFMMPPFECIDLNV